MAINTKALCSVIAFLGLAVTGFTAGTHGDIALIAFVIAMLFALASND